MHLILIHNDLTRCKRHGLDQTHYSGKHILTKVTKERYFIQTLKENIMRDLLHQLGGKELKQLLLINQTTLLKVIAIELEKRFSKSLRKSWVFMQKCIHLVHTLCQTMFYVARTCHNVRHRTDDVTIPVVVLWISVSM